jgi:hypothetical protein
MGVFGWWYTRALLKILNRRKLFLSTEYNFVLVVMARILRSRIGIEHWLISETDSDEAVLYDSESGSG